MLSCAKYCREPVLARGVELNDLQGFLPTSTSL